MLVNLLLIIFLKEYKHLQWYAGLITGAMCALAQVLMPWWVFLFLLLNLRTVGKPNASIFCTQVSAIKLPEARIWEEQLRRYKPWRKRKNVSFGVLTKLWWKHENVRLQQVRGKRPSLKRLTWLISSVIQPCSRRPNLQRKIYKKQNN